MMELEEFIQRIIVGRSGRGRESESVQLPILKPSTKNGMCKDHVRRRTEIEVSSKLQRRDSTAIGQPHRRGLVAGLIHQRIGSPVPIDVQKVDQIVRLEARAG